MVDSNGVEIPERPRKARTRFGFHNARSNLNDLYASRTLWESQPRNDDGSLMQLRDWKKMGAEDLTLIESLVAQNDPEALQPGHDYQQLAMHRGRLASNRLRFARRFQQDGLIPLKVTAMQQHPDKHEQSPFFQKMRDQPFNLRCHQPCIIPPSNAPAVFDEKMSMKR